jgi:hypothetical protein
MSAKFIPPADALAEVLKRTRGGEIAKRFVIKRQALQVTRNGQGAVFVWSPHRSVSAFVPWVV